MPQVHITIVGKLKDNDSAEEKEVTLTGYAQVITFSPGTPPPRPHPEPPLVIWGPGDPRPTLPIAGWDPGTGTWPGAPGGGGEHEPKFEWKTGWTPETGWIVVGIPQFPHVTPSGS